MPLWLWWWRVVGLLWPALSVWAKETKNGILRSPVVRCGVDGVVFEMETRSPFAGQLYVQNEYRRPDFERMGRIMRRRVILDGRNIYPQRLMEEHGFERHGVGIPPVRGPVQAG